MDKLVIDRLEAVLARYNQIQEDLQVVLSEYYIEIDDTTEVEDDLHEISENSISWYCAEDDDFYTGAIINGDFVTECIKMAIYQQKSILTYL